MAGITKDLAKGHNWIFDTPLEQDLNPDPVSGVNLTHMHTFTIDTVYMYIYMYIFPLKRGIIGY